MPATCEHLWRPEKNARPLGTGVIGSRELPAVNAGKRTHVLWKGTVCSYTPSHFSSPSYGFLTQFAVCGGTNKGLLSDCFSGLHSFLRISMHLKKCIFYFVSINVLIASKLELW